MHLPKIFEKFKSGRLAAKLSESRNRRKMLLSIAFLIVFAVFLSKYAARQVTFKADEVAESTVQSPVTAVVVDELETEKIRIQAANEVQKSYKEDPQAFSHSEQVVRSFFSTVNAAIADENIAADERAAQLLAEFNSRSEESPLNAEELDQLGIFLAGLSLEDRQKIEDYSVYTLSLFMDKPITAETLPQVRIEYEERIKNSSLNANEKVIVALVGKSALRANLIYDSVATEKARSEAKQKVEPVQKTIKTGETVVRQGERVTPAQIEILKQLGLQRNESYLPDFLGIFVVLLFTGFLTLQIIEKYRPKVYENNKLLALILLIVVLVVVISRVLLAIKIGDRPEINNLVAYLAPVAAGAMLLAILLDGRLAYFMTVVMAIYVGLLAEGNQLIFMTVAFVSGVVGIYRVSKFSQTSDLAKAGFYVALANITMIFGLSLIGGSSWQVLLISMALGAVSGLLSTVLMIGILPYLESLFSVTSVIKLLELSNPNTKILKRLLLEAPGTYHHSLMVGNLAEATAELIKANPLLVRIGAYYHDIGKLKRPEYYIENQSGINNPHEKIAPELSAMIIISHVRDGIEIAKQENLPPDIIDFIATHHGNSMTRYFYEQALKADKGKVNEQDFRYEGPRPGTKETALVMLADSVEAAVRSLKEPTVENIRRMVHAIIRDKLADGQLEKSELTLKDLDIIGDRFCSLLEGVYHKRIEYPQAAEQQAKNRF